MGRKLDDRGICQIEWHKKTAITKVFAAFIGMVEKNNKKTYNIKHRYSLHHNSSINWIKLQYKYI